MQVRFGYVPHKPVEVQQRVQLPEPRLPQGPDMGMNSRACFTVKVSLVLLHV